MRKLLTALFLLFFVVSVKAQTTIGQTKEQIRKLIQTNPNFKLLAGDNCDTLDFTQGMQAIFNYKENICFKSISILPLNYMPAIVDKMTTDSYKKINNTTWIDPKETIKVTITTNKILCFVTTVAYNKANAN